MENLILLHRFGLGFQVHIEGGESTRTALLNTLGKSDNVVHRRISGWLFCFDQQQDTTVILRFSSVYEQALIEILRAGLLGHKIYDRLVEFQRELQDICFYEIERSIDRLPYQMMIPVLLLQFPAYLILIFGPILNQFIKSLGGNI